MPLWLEIHNTSNVTRIKQRDLKSPYEFDEVRISYFDGKDKEHINKLAKIKMYGKLKITKR